MAGAELRRTKTWPYRQGDLNICGTDGVTEAASLRRESKEKSCESRVHRDTSADGQHQESPWSWGGGPDVAHGHAQDTNTGAMFHHPLRAPGEVKRGNQKGRWFDSTCREPDQGVQRRIHRLRRIREKHIECLKSYTLMVEVRTDNRGSSTR